MLVDSVDGMQIFSYDEHKLLSNPRAVGVNPGMYLLPSPISSI
jgi:hypothetical protein